MNLKKLFKIKDKKKKSKKIAIISMLSFFFLVVSFFVYYKYSQASYSIISFTEVGSHNWIVPEGVRNVEILVVAGGGSGGSNVSGTGTAAGGGGAGGLIHKTSHSVLPGQNISISVGAGGVAPATPAVGSDGGNSKFDTLVAIGGGGGGSRYNAPNNGGSGGGVGYVSTVGGSGTSGQGNNGGGSNPSIYGGAGGGGADGPGVSSVDHNGTNGGGGLCYSSIFGTSYGENGCFAGGGGGGGVNSSHTAGQGGSGGAGNGGLNSNGFSAIENTGSGGGGSGTVYKGGDGGSGIVLIRYEVKDNKASVAMNKGLVAHYTMNETDYNHSNNRVTDKTPYENHGSNYGATFTEDRFGKEGGAMSFDGMDSFISAPPVLINNPITISMWTNRVGSSNAFNPLVEQGGSRRFRLINYRDRICFGNDSSTNSFYCTGVVTSEINSWYHVVGLFDGDYHIFINGVEVSVSNLPGNYASWGSNQLNIGYRPYTSAVGSFNGGIDDVRIYNRALSESEIESLYDTYNPKTTTGSLQKGLILDMPLKLKYTKSEASGSEIMTDRTPYGNDGQNYGAVVTSEGTSFNNTSDYINLGNGPNFNITDKITLSAWVKLNSYKDFDTILWKSYNSIAGANSSYGLSLTTGRRFRFGLTSQLISPNIAEIGKWYHIVGTYDGQTQKLYEDGNLVITTSRSGPINVSTQDLVIGNRKYNSSKAYPFNGGIEGVHIYNRAISEEEVKTLYDRGRSDAGIIFQEN